MIITPPRAPNLPTAPTAYSPSHEDEFAKALRLYFNRIDAMFVYLLSTTNINIVDTDPTVTSDGDTWVLVTAGTPNTYQLSVATPDGIKRTSLT